MWQCCSKNGLIYWIIDKYKLINMLECIHVKHVEQGIRGLTNAPSYCSPIITLEFQNAFVYTVYIFIENKITDKRFYEIQEHLYDNFFTHFHLFNNRFNTITFSYLLKNIYVEALKLIHNSLKAKHKHAFTELSEIILKLYLKHHNFTA